MNDDYIWDKTGDDRETMRLEKALAVFRYCESDPPALPPEEHPRRRRFLFAYAIPAFAVLTLAAGLWLGVMTGGDDDEVTFVHHPAADASEQIPEPEAPAAQPPASLNPPVPPTRRAVMPTIASAPRRSRAKTRLPKTSTVATLTKEERHAYEQLMLALAISGSKIKIVQNAIHGVEENENPRMPNDRQEK